MNEECQFVMFPCFLLFLDSTHILFQNDSTLGEFFPWSLVFAVYPVGIISPSCSGCSLALPLSLPFGLKWITQEVTTESLTALQLTRPQWCSDFCVKSLSLMLKVGTSAWLYFNTTKWCVFRRFKHQLDCKTVHMTCHQSVTSAPLVYHKSISVPQVER